MKAEWTSEIPKTPGRYWLCGWRWTNEKASGPAQMHLVTVAKTANSVALFSDGAILHEAEGLEGMWTPAVLPDKPKIEPHFYRGLTVLLKSQTEAHEVDDVDFGNRKVKTRPCGTPSYYSVWRDFEEYKFAGE